ncbi:tetratricopeptide repeat protein [Teladorsagia circumcincta]|uniref:Tetratricopeptide repeat protein n=1 Tax=Teladorsagia circumcincta TaxID=45464 RepID=A0A2G9V1V4_TELCI|nr:tetratricopeptide repeat protein [Teladorsagia circumcincta]
MQYILGLLALLLVSVDADVFTSIADMQSLLQSEKAIPKILRKYIESEYDRLENLKDLIRKYEERNEEAMNTDIKDLINPINAFLFIKKKIFDWKGIEQAMMLNKADSFLERIASKDQGFRYPTEEDLSGAAIGLLRLQDTYRLDTRDLADGRIYKKQGNLTFSAGDCFEIAKAAYNDNDFYHTVMWMEEARRRLQQEDVPTANLGQILEYLAYSLFKQGNPKHALQLSEELVALEPNHPRASGNVKFYEDYLAKEGVKKIDMRRSLGRVLNERPQSVLGNKERTIYEALCRNEVPVSEKDISKLYCYLKRDRPYLVYAPIKVEIKRFNPLAVLFKEVISDEEIKVLEELAIPRLARATVHDSATGKLVHATYRISKSAWLKGWEHEVVDCLNKRIDMMTNLEMETAEELQMTEPTYGGGTVFTDVKSSVLPTKNDALFWYNLLKTGDGDTRTRHAACPVLLGVKWVTNKWVHERGNEFRRPCGLKMSDGERFIGDLGFGPEPRNAPNLSPDLSKDIFSTIK